MTVPVQISFHGIDPTPAMRDLVNEETAKLEHVYPHIISCRVAVELAAHRHKHGNPYQIRIELAVPGKLLVVDSKPESDGPLAVREAFKTLERNLHEFARKKRGD